MSVQNGNNLMNAGTQDLTNAGVQGALAVTGNAHPVMQGLAGLPLTRQIGLMLGLALSVAVGVAVVLWSQAPSYGLLFSEVGDKDASEILEILESEGVKYRVESGSGAIMVPADKVHELKLKLASQGLPKSKSLGYDLLDKDPGFGTSKSVEALRFQRALEGEIAQTVMSIQNVKSARVLLAMPQQSVFVRDRKKPSASVMVNLYQGRSLDKEQIQSIVHLVASSVPLLEAEQVTVVDQKGQLLNSKDSSSEVYLASRQLEYKKNIEEHLMERIANILTPLVGSNGMRVQLSADVDFTQTEKTQEMFNPDGSVLRSEQAAEEKNTLSAVQGVPGALSNQPTPAGTAPEKVTAADSQKNAANTENGSFSKSTTRNFELDKTITHTRMGTGAISRLTVAVVVDDRHTVGKDGKAANQPYTADDINRLGDLVKQTVGYDSKRGDQVTVTNVSFNPNEEMESLPEIPVWEQVWFAELMKQLIAAATILLLLFGVLRPAVRGLIGRVDDKKEPDKAEAAAAANNASVDGNPPADKAVPEAVPADDRRAEHAALASARDEFSLLSAPQSYERHMEYVQRLVDENPKLVVQTIKAWIKDE
ncbi:flagellar basal-body MS-ring/collar protein FliF [Methylomicrobium agile]|uniref:flagellar basal-body MS-ring/collar protein FliF n=1 Tax=Methylomicrobium agile TaxID=39774 RepID=UPI0004DFC9C7|nr:flagellar basal-body MS-ring/collar protein FliF [Methylomicrobium agile]